MRTIEIRTNEMRTSLEDVYSAPRLFIVKQFKQGDPYFVYYPDTTLLASLIHTDAGWRQMGGRPVSGEMVEALGAHIEAVGYISF